MVIHTSAMIIEWRSASVKKGNRQRESGKNWCRVDVSYGVRVGTGSGDAGGV